MWWPSSIKITSKKQKCEANDCFWVIFYFYYSFRWLMRDKCNLPHPVSLVTCHKVLFYSSHAHIHTSNMVLDSAKCYKELSCLRALQTHGAWDKSWRNEWETRLENILHFTSPSPAAEHSLLFCLDGSHSWEYLFFILFFKGYLLLVQPNAYRDETDWTEQTPQKRICNVMLTAHRPTKPNGEWDGENLRV